MDIAPATTYSNKYFVTFAIICIIFIIIEVFNIWQQQAADKSPELNVEGYWESKKWKNGQVFLFISEYRDNLHTRAGFITFINSEGKLVENDPLTIETTWTANFFSTNLKYGAKIYGTEMLPQNAIMIIREKMLDIYDDDSNEKIITLRKVENIPDDNDDDDDDESSTEKSSNSDE